MRRRDAGLSGIQAYGPLSITLHQRRARTLPPCPRLEWKPNNERGSERREDFDPAFPGRSIQDCDSRYHILRTNVNTKFRNGGIARIRAPRSSFRSIDLGELTVKFLRPWTRNAPKRPPLGKKEHHPARHLPLTQSIHDPIYIGQGMCSDVTVNFSPPG